MTNANRSSATDSMKKDNPSNRWFIEERLAVLLRLLGVYFVACAIVSGVEAASHISLGWGWSGGDEFWVCMGMLCLAQPAAELIVGIYFVLGGQWVFNKILTPIARRPVDTNQGD